MATIEITLKSGKVVAFKEVGRPGGSYSNSVRYEGSFVIVRDEWGEETAFPASDVEKVVNTPERGRW